MVQQEIKRDDPLKRATDAVREEDLEHMLLDVDDLPSELTGFEIAREGILDNTTMADHGFPGQTVESIGARGRITGYVREFAPEELETALDGDLITVGTVIHLFETDDGPSQWIDDIFLKEFLGSVGNLNDNGHELIHAEQVELSGFYGKSASIFAVHEIPNGTLGSTIVDFSIGRLLGVTFAVTLGETQNLELAKDLALSLERQVVSVALGSTY
ncbi:MAG TPA: hypothetical protein DEU64_03705 [Dehalococcoidia bacterium]|nr:hypothetical protein [Dehalococcoidia bacterium]